MRGSRKRLLFGSIVLMLLCLVGTGNAHRCAQAAEEDFVIVDGVLTQYTGTDTELVIPDGVTEIAGEVFAARIPEPSTITKVTIPDSVTRIGASAFGYCSGLETVEGMRSVKEIGENAFYNCVRLKEIDLSSVQAIGGNAFFGCGLKKIVLAKNMEFLGDDAFRCCTGLAQIQLPEKLSVCGGRVFDKTAWLEKQREKTKGMIIHDGILLDAKGCEGRVVVPETVRSIPGYVFSDNEKITEVVLPKQVKELGAEAFRGCTGLEKINLDAIESVGTLAFERCSRLKEIRLSSVKILGEKAFCRCTSLKKAVLAEKMESIGQEAFSGCSVLAELGLPKKLSACGKNAFEGTAWLQKQHEEIKGLIFLDGILVDAEGCEGRVVVPETMQIIPPYIFRNNEKITEVVLPKQVKEIGNNAFSGCTNLKTIHLESVEKIGSAAFSGCTGLTEIVLPEQIKEIDNDTFRKCENLCKVNLDAVETIGESAFSGCKRLATAGSLGNITSLGADAFLQTELLKNAKKQDGLVILDGILFDGAMRKGTVNVPKGVRVIAPKAFEYNKDIVKVVLPDSVVFVGELAFCDCLSLKTVWMEDSVREIASGAFSGCKKLQNIRLSNSISGLKGLFEGCRSLKTVTLPEGLTGISWVDIRRPMKKVTISPGMSSEVCRELIDDGCFGKAQLYTTSPEEIGAELKEYLKSQGRPIQELRLTEATLTLKKGQSRTLEMNSGAKCSWKSSEPSVASVTNYGRVTARKAGTAVISATIYGKTYRCKVKVSAALQ